MAEVVLSTQRVSPSSIQLQSWKNITCRPDGLGLGLLSTMGLQGRVRVSIGPTCERVNRGGDMARRTIRQSSVINEESRERWSIDMLISPSS